MLILKMPQRRDSAGTVCNSGMGIFFDEFDLFSLPLNVVFSVCVHMRNGTYITTKLIIA